MPKVYRVENADRQGPYALFGQGFTNRTHSAPTHPGPYEEFPTWWEQTGTNPDWNRHKFGFTSMQQLKNWFNDEELATLACKGFSIVEVEATILHQSDKQCVFLDERQGNGY